MVPAESIVVQCTQHFLINTSSHITLIVAKMKTPNKLMHKSNYGRIDYECHTNSNGVPGEELAQLVRARG